MKYTKENLHGKIAVHVGNDEETLNIIRKIFGLGTTSGCVYREEHCINLQDGCHQTVSWYKQKGYEVISIDELFLNETYEIY